MTDFKWGAFGSPSTGITMTADVTNGSRRAFDYANSTNKHLLAHLLIEGIQYLTTAPTAGTIVAEVYVLPGDGQGSETFPGGGGRNGGDTGDVGQDRDPQPIWLAAVVTCINPSTAADDDPLGCIVPIFPGTNRIVIKNVSGQTWDADPDNITVEVVPFSYAF